MFSSLKPGISEREYLRSCPALEWLRKSCNGRDAAGTSDMFKVGGQDDSRLYSVVGGRVVFISYASEQELASVGEAEGDMAILTIKREYGFITRARLQLIVSAKEDDLARRPDLHHMARYCNPVTLLLCRPEFPFQNCFGPQRLPGLLRFDLLRQKTKFAVMVRPSAPNFQLPVIVDSIGRSDTVSEPYCRCDFDILLTVLVCRSEERPYDTGINLNLST